MRELLFELGCEELPAGSLRRAALDLKAGIEKRLKEAGVAFQSQDEHYTPRRLIVWFTDVEETQPDQQRIQRGPAVSSAYDADGRPTRALEGFCRGQGVDPNEVVKDGDYVWVKKTIPGLATIELLQEILPEAVVDVQFTKTMRWADGTFRFARPIRWILASFGGEAVPFAIEGVTSGLNSRGHRFRAPEEFEAISFAELRSGLKDRSVEVSHSERREKIQREVSSLTGDSAPSADLVDENADLTEWPEALLGEFKEEFLQLPIPVLTTVMAKHERFFPVKNSNGGLKNQFVSVRNGGEEAAVREGNAWVLNARFNDARFFFEEDKKHSLAESLERTSSMTFQEKLGSVRQRADRLAFLAKDVALWSGADEDEAGFAHEAGLYAKADLSTGLVSELDELQGVIGGEYARREGFSDPVCWAITSHYDLARNPSPACEGARTAVRLLISDHLDKLAGFLGIGFVPTGSSDPYGLRRSATLLIEAAWAWPTVLPGYLPVVQRAFDTYSEQGFEVDRNKGGEALQEVFASRYEAMLDGKHDHCEAATLPGGELLDPRAVAFRLSVIKVLAEDSKFVQTATRPPNIVAAAVKNGIEFESANVNTQALKSPEAEALWTCVQSQKPLAAMAAQAEDRDGLIQALNPLTGPVSEFFDSTMVMVEDTDVRNARLKMLSETDKVFRLAGDFTKIVIDG